jgi:hypothetical protein
VSARRNSTAPVVQRRYLAETDACEAAIKSLLNGQVNKAVEPASKPEGRYGTKVKESSGYDATTKPTN